MSTVATKPRKSAPKLPATSTPAGHKRPEASSPVGLSVRERVANLADTLHKADNLLESAYDAAERGSTVDTLLDLIAHDLLVDAMGPIVRADYDDASTPVTKGDAAVAYKALFPVLAALEGAMALATGTALYSALADVFKLLDWAQEECDAAALGKLLPEVGEEASLASPGQDAARPNAGESDPRTRIAEAVAVLLAAAHEHGRGEVWGVHSLVKLVERTLDSANSEDADDLQEVSNLLEQLLAVIEKVNDEALDCMLLHAGASLLTTAKELVDHKCEAVS